MLKPKELTLTFLGVGTGSDKVLTAISVKVYPLAHMIEVVILLGGNLYCAVDLCQVVCVHANDIDATILLAWYEEAIRNMDSAFPKDIMRDDRDIVRPLEAWCIELDRLKHAHITILHGFLHSWNNVDMAGTHGAKARYKQKVLASIELSHIDERSILKAKFVVRSERKIGIGRC